MLSALTTLLLVTGGTCSNVGWKSFMRENPTEFHDLPLTWEPSGDRVPEWLSGTYVRNGPAQVISLLSTPNPQNLRSYWLLRKREDEICYAWLVGPGGVFPLGSNVYMYTCLIKGGATNSCPNNMFLGPRGPLRIPLITVLSHKKNPDHVSSLINHHRNRLKAIKYDILFSRQISFGSERRHMSSWLEGFGKLHSFKLDGPKVF